MNIDFKKGIINGIIIYVVVFIAISVLIAFKIDTGGLIGQAVGLISVTVAAYYLASKMDFKDMGSALGYGVLTALVVLVLDYVITLRFNPNANLFSIEMLVGDALIILAPVVAKQMKK